MLLLLQHYPPLSLPPFNIYVCMSKHSPVYVLSFFPPYILCKFFFLFGKKRQLGPSTIYPPLSQSPRDRFVAIRAYPAVLYPPVDAAASLSSSVPALGGNVGCALYCCG